MEGSTERGSGSGFGSGAVTESIDARMWEFISSDITRGILEWTLMVFGLVKEGNLEFLDARLGAFRAEIAAWHWGLIWSPQLVDL